MFRGKIASQRMKFVISKKYLSYISPYFGPLYKFSFCKTKKTKDFESSISFYLFTSIYYFYPEILGGTCNINHQNILKIHEKVRGQSQIKYPGVDLEE
jgi:hypothetical protein